MSKNLILFIHGLSGDKNTWGNFWELISADTELNEKYDVESYDYLTNKIYIWGITKKCPKIQVIANGLRTKMESRYLNYDTVVLVCHSMGGLVARRYLLQEKKRNRKTKVNKLLLYAVPNDGSDVATLARLPLIKKIISKQVEQLCPDSDFIEDLNEDWNIFKMGDEVDTYYFLGDQDQFINQTSKYELYKEAFFTIPNKDHYNIVKPFTKDDISFIKFKQSLNDQTQKMHLKNVTANINSKSEMNTRLILTNGTTGIFEMENQLSKIDKTQSQFKQEVTQEKESIEKKVKDIISGGDLDKASELIDEALKNHE